MIQLASLYCEALDGVAEHSEIYYSVLMLVKKGFIEIMDELFETIEVSSYSHYENQLQSLEKQNKELENTIFVYRKDIKDLHNQLSEQNRNLNNQINESNKL